MLYSNAAPATINLIRSGGDVRIESIAIRHLGLNIFVSQIGLAGINYKTFSAFILTYFLVGLFIPVDEVHDLIILCICKRCKRHAHDNHEHGSQQSQQTSFEVRFLHVNFSYSLVFI